MREVLGSPLMLPPRRRPRFGTAPTRRQHDFGGRRLAVRLPHGHISRFSAGTGGRWGVDGGGGIHREGFLFEGRGGGDRNLFTQTCSLPCTFEPAWLTPPPQSLPQGVIPAQPPEQAMAYRYWGMAAWATPPPPHISFPPEKNEFYRRGPKLSVDFRYTNCPLFFCL